MDPTPVIPAGDAPSSGKPPAIPRPMNPAIRRRIALEPRVLSWWLLTLLIIVIFSGYAGDRLWARHVETRLIHSGQFVRAKIIAAENKISNMPIGPGDHMQLEVDATGERLDGYLSANSAVGNEIMLHLDPADHSIWTDRAQPTPLLDSMLIGTLMLPLIPLILLIGYLKMRALAGTWQRGSPAAAVIFDRRQSSIAPMSYTVRCSLANNRKKQLFAVHVPRVGFGLEKGEMIWVILPVNKGSPLAALWME